MSTEAKDVVRYKNENIALEAFITGAQVTSAAALGRSANLNWTAERVPLKREDNVAIRSHVAIKRSDTGATIGIVGKGYGIIQPSDMMEMADAMLGEIDGYTKSQAIVIGGGSRAVIQLVGPVRKVGDGEAQSNVTIFNSWDASLQWLNAFADTWIICRNTFQAAMREAANGIKLRHTASAPERVKEAIRTIEALRKYTGVLDNRIIKMMGAKLTDDQFRVVTEILAPPDDKGNVSAQKHEARAELTMAYHKAPGAMPGTAWGGFQAITYYLSHKVPMRLSSDRTAAQARQENLWWGNGSTMMRKAWELMDKVA